LQPWQLTITVVVRSVNDSLSASTPWTLMGIAWTRRVLRRLSSPGLAADDDFVTSLGDGWIREIVSCSPRVSVDWG